MSELTRKLAAIMFTDIAGYTALSAHDEEKALELIEKQREVLQPIVLEHEGRWLKEIGDGVLISFPSSKRAVECAIKIQRTVKEIEDLNLRIGIHEGDILEKEGDVFGNDVNIASRIEPFAAVGGIAITDKVQRDISASPEFTTKYIGQPNLKGVRQEVKVYCIVSHGLPETDLAEVSAKLEPPSKEQILLGGSVREQLTARNIILTVFFSLLLGFSFLFVATDVSRANIFGFSRAFAGESRRTAILEVEARTPDLDPILLQASRSELYKALQRFPGLRLIGDYEIRQLDTRNLSRKSICDQLNTNYLITCSLLKTDGDYLVDSELYRRDQDHIVTHYSQHIPSLSLQETSRLIADSLSRHFAGVLGISPRIAAVDISLSTKREVRLFSLFRKPSAAPKRVEKKAVAHDDNVYRILVQGQQLLSRGTLEDNLDAIVLVEEALLADSANADLLVALADAYYQRGQLQGGVEELAGKSGELLAKAMGSGSISDEALATAHYLLSTMQLARDELGSARASIRTAMRLNRSDPRIRAHFKTITKLLLEKMIAS